MYKSIDCQSCSFRSKKVGCEFGNHSTSDMDKLGIFFFAVLVISVITQTYSAPPIRSPKPLDLSGKVFPRVESLRTNIPKELQNEVLGNFREYSIGTSFETRVRPVEVFPSNPEILRTSRPKPSDVHVQSSSRTRDNSNGFHFSPLDLSKPKKKSESFPRLWDSSLRSEGKTIDIASSKAEVQYGGTSLPRPSSLRVDDLLKPGENSNGFHFSATNSLAFSKKRTKSSSEMGRRKVSAKSGLPEKKVRNNEESTLNSETGRPSQLINMDNIYTGRKIPAIDSNGKAVFLEFYSFNTEAGPKDMMYVPQAVRHAYYDAGIFETVFRTPDGREFEWKTFAKPWLNSEQGFLSGDLFGESPQNPLRVTIPMGEGLFRTFEVPREVRDNLGNYAKWYENNLINHYHGVIPGTIKNNDRSASNVIFEDSFPPSLLEIGYNKFKMPAYDSKGKIVFVDVLTVGGPSGFHSETALRTADGRLFEWKTGKARESTLKQVYHLDSSAPKLSF